MNKEIYTYEQAKDKVLSGLAKISEPVVQTLSPKGRNVFFENEQGQPAVTNDGVTIARQIDLKDPLENLVAQAVKQAALATNRIAGDGTTTTVLLTQVLIKQAFKLIDAGWNAMDLKKEIEKNAILLLDALAKSIHKVKTDKDLEFIAGISANNDTEIAKNVVDIIKTVGETGNIIIDNHAKEKTEIIKEQGFLHPSGMAFPDLSNQPGKFLAIYDDVKVLVTDKRLYYDTEAIAIMEIVKKAGFDDVVIIAREFIGKAPNVFITNHTQGKMNVLLVKDTSAGEVYRDNLEDLADYLGCPLISEKSGNLVDNLSIKDFGTAKKIISDQHKTLIVASRNNPALQLRIKALKEEAEKTNDELDKNRFEKRIGSLTNGVVTLRVGGRTQIEIREKTYRYEDSINATRNAVKAGYIVGGGLTLANAYHDIEFTHKDVAGLFNEVCLASVTQIAKNCNEHLPTLLSNISDKVGYNALTGKYEDLLKAGVIEPFTVLEQAIKNAVSVSCAIISSGSWLINIKDEPRNSKED